MEVKSSTKKINKLDGETKIDLVTVDVGDEEEEDCSGDGKEDFGNKKFIYDPDNFEKLCRESKASDYYAHAMEDKHFGVVAVAVCPVVFFDKYGYLLDLTPDIYHLLPPSLRGEMMDAIYEGGKSTVEYNAHTMKDELALRGFIFSDKFSACAEKYI